MTPTKNSEDQMVLTIDDLNSISIILKGIREKIDQILPTDEVIAKLSKISQDPSVCPDDLDAPDRVFGFFSHIEKIRGLLLQTERVCGLLGEWMIKGYMELEQEGVEDISSSFYPLPDLIALEDTLKDLRMVNIALEEPLDLAVETLDYRRLVSDKAIRDILEKLNHHLTKGKDMSDNPSTLRSFTKKEIGELVEENIEMCNTFLRMVYRLSEEDAPAIKALGNTISTLYTPLLTDQSNEEFLRIPKVEIILHKKLKEVVHLYMKKYAEYDSETLLDLDVDDVLRDAREWENRLEAFNWAWMSRLYSPDKKVL